MCLSLKLELKPVKLFYEFLRCDNIVCISRTNFHYFFIDLSNIKVPFLKKLQSFLVQRFSLNSGKKFKCFLNCQFYTVHEKEAAILKFSTGMQFLKILPMVESLLRNVFHWQFLATYIFYVSLKFRACYITGQWDEFTLKNASLYLHVLSCFFFCCFLSKKKCFWWIIEFPQQNIKQSETGIGDNKVSLELYVSQKNSL